MFLCNRFKERHVCKMAERSLAPRVVSSGHGQASDNVPVRTIQVRQLGGLDTLLPVAQQSRIACWRKRPQCSHQEALLDCRGIVSCLPSSTGTRLAAGLLALSTIVAISFASQMSSALCERRSGSAGMPRDLRKSVGVWLI
jgi:hypothetical protein